MGMIKLVANQIIRSGEKIKANGWDIKSYERHYVAPEDHAALATELIRGVPAHIARARKTSVQGVEVRALEVLGPEWK